MKGPKEIFANPRLCTACKTCEIACAVEHSKTKSLYSALAERPQPKRRLYVEPAKTGLNIPILCRHCEDAPCMHACITGAISKTQAGVVITDQDRCIGCWTCVMVCPFGVIGRHLETQKAYRCDRCPDREVPACVSACPTKALIYKEAEDFSRDRRVVVATEMFTKE